MTAVICAADVCSFHSVLADEDTGGRPLLEANMYFEVGSYLGAVR